MPCYYTGSREGDLRMSRDNAIGAATKATDMLCRVLTDVEAGYGFKSLPDDILEWWEGHKKLDAESQPHD